MTPFAAGMTLHLGATGEVLCQVSSMLGYLAICPSTLGPLFLFQDGSPLSRPRLVKSLHQVLIAAGVDCSGYSGQCLVWGGSNSCKDGASLFHGTERTGTDQNTSLFHGTERTVRVPPSYTAQCAHKIPSQ